MNYAERIAGTYLRLNGFLLLPHFTTFFGPRNNHVDLIGVRTPGSREKVSGYILPTDRKLFSALSEEVGANPRRSPIGVIAEVRTSSERDNISEQQIAYVQAFLGGLRPITLTFFRTPQTVWRDTEGIGIGVSYAIDWIQWRVSWMEKRHLNKVGSWNLSEEFLGQILAERRIRRRQ
jgi:hypothetical protein